MNCENVVNFIFEAQALRLQKHTGWWLAGVKNPDSVAEHSHLTAVIAYVLATMEGHSNPSEICTRAVFHDLHETRLGDQHKISSNYYKIPKEVKQKVEREQANLIPRGEKLLKTLQNSTPEEYAIFKDSDYLEMAFTAKQYLEQGHAAAQTWINRIEQVLNTKSAKAILQQLKNTSSANWWKNLKEPTQQLKY